MKDFFYNAATDPLLELFMLLKPLNKSTASYETETKNLTNAK